MSDQGLVRALFSYQGSESIEPLDQYIALQATRRLQNCVHLRRSFQ